jgi:hypothetical protein
MITKNYEKDLKLLSFLQDRQDKNSIDSQNINFSKRAYRKKPVNLDQDKRDTIGRKIIRECYCMFSKIDSLFIPANQSSSVEREYVD